MICKAVIFDLDGVITDTARYHYLAWKRLADRLGIYFDEQINERLRGVSRMGSFEIILERADRPFGVEEKERCVAEKNAFYTKLLEEMSEKDILPGAMEFVGELEKRGIRTAIASASRNAPFVLSKLGIADRFDYIVDAAKIARGKPDPEAFLNAAANLGVAPRRCIGVEDAAAGIAAIKAAGMFAVGVGNPETVIQADLIIPDLTEHFRILRLIDA